MKRDGDPTEKHPDASLDRGQPKVGPDSEIELGTDEVDGLVFMYAPPRFRRRLGEPDVALRLRVMETLRDWMRPITIGDDVVKTEYLRPAHAPLPGVDNGTCPQCGHRGEWRNLALVCPTHGRFAG